MKILVGFILSICLWHSANAITVDVTNTAQTGFGGQLIPGSLAWAINLINSVGPGPHRINIMAAGSVNEGDFREYQITNNNVTIDATLAPGYTCGRPVFFIDAQLWGGFLSLAGNNISVRGIGLNNCCFLIGGNDVSIFGCWFNLNATGTASVTNAGRFSITLAPAADNATIGANSSCDANYFAGGTVHSAILISGAGNNLSINGNYFGTAANGTTLLTGFPGGAIFLGGDIGSNVTISNNVIGGGGGSGSGSVPAGISIINARIGTGLIINNNYVGVSRSFTNLGNSSAGLFISGLSTAFIVRDNIIGFNGSNQVSNGISIENSANGTISNNYIGVNAAGLDIGNAHSGIEVNRSSAITISDNTIRFNKSQRTTDQGGGIAVINGSSRIDITGNTITNNSEHGILVEASATLGSTREVNATSNIIANNGSNGINVLGADFVQMNGNSIYCNSAKGINLNCSGTRPGNSSNNSGSFFPKPLLNTAASGPTTISGSTWRATNVEVYTTRTCVTANAAVFNCGGIAQGETFLANGSIGSATASALRCGNTNVTSNEWSYTSGTPIQDVITVLATGTGTHCSNGYCRTSEFSDCEDNSLPVNWYYIKVISNGSDNDIKWATAQEKNTSYFIVERSNDGDNFSAISEQIKAAGNAANTRDYSFTDEFPLSGKNYYRILQVDNDGSYDYSDIHSTETNGSLQVMIAPNPNNGNFFVDINAPEEEAVDFVIVDVFGKIVYRTRLNLLQGNIHWQLDLSGIEKSLYMVKVNGINVEATEKLIVE